MTAYFVPNSTAQVVKSQINDRRCKKRQYLTENKPSHHSNAQRMAQLRSDSGTDHQWKRTKQGGHSRHHNRPEAQQACLIYGFARRLAFFALSIKGKVNHHNGILLHDADEQDDTYDTDDAQVASGNHEREQRADPGGRQS